MKLVIAEKPVLGKAIAEALPGKGFSKDGCIIKGDYIITWVFGHMLSLKEPEDYDESYKNWNTQVLPIYFPNWGVKIGKDAALAKGQMTKAQRVNQIGKLLKQADMVIHAGDPDDEGQLLVDELLRWFDYKGRVMRLDTANTTVEAMRKSLTHMTDNKAHESYGWSAYARSVADLMVGINMSRLFTCKNKVLLTIGRVQTPTLGLVVNRDAIIEGHVKQIYYGVTCDIDINNKVIPAKFCPSETDSQLVDGKIISKEYAEKICQLLDKKNISNINITKKTIKEAPPLPFNLVKLQSYCSSHFGYSPQEVLDVTQKLRENYQAITYNRSDCQYLSEEHFKEAPGVLNAVIWNIKFKPTELSTSIKSKCFDSTKISAHFAIIPTEKKVDISKMSEAERNIYLAICKYYMAQFMPNAVKEQTRLVVELDKGAKLQAISTVVTSLGYRAIFKEAKQDEVSTLSSINAGIYSGVTANSKCIEKETKPPARYTKATLNEDMTCISKYVNDENIKRLLLSKDEGKEGEKGSIGTSATRSSIIENLVKRGFLQEDGKKVISTPLGRELYRILPDEIKKADMTAQWWAYQEDIQLGNKSCEELLNNVLSTITHIVKNVDSYPKVNEGIIAKTKKSANATVVGLCPRCGGNVIEGKMGFGCTNWKEPTCCKFVIWKKSKSPIFTNETITVARAKKLLEGKAVEMKNLVSVKTGKTFTAKVTLVDNPLEKYSPSLQLSFK